MRYTELPIAKEWPSLLSESKGVPLRIPNTVEITGVARITITLGGEPWQLRTAAIDPAASGWVDLNAGQLDRARPVSDDE